MIFLRQELTQQRPRPPVPVKPARVYSPRFKGKPIPVPNYNPQEKTQEEVITMLTPDAERRLQEFAAAAYGPAVTTVAPGVTHVLGWGHSSAVIIEGNTGIILIDTLDTDVRGARLRELVRERTGKTVHTIIYTHGHPDHRGGARAFAADAREIIAFAPRRPSPGRTGELSAILAKRTNYQFGYDQDDAAVIAQGLGIREGFTVGEGQYAFLPPTTVYREDRVERTIDGVRLEMVALGGETDDQIGVWLPDAKVLISGDNYYACWPNLYALRGSPYRDVDAWVAALTTLLAYPAEALLPGHTPPLLGRETVQEVLTNYRDAIDYVLSETLRGMNQGLGPDALAATIRLPERYARLPYLQEYYGTVAWSVRSIYQGYLGWFDGNPTHLNPLPLAESAARMVALAGGAERVGTEIQTALAQGEYQWAVELCDLLLGAGMNAAEARRWKAAGLQALGRMETSACGRHYYLAAARELLGGE